VISVARYPYALLAMVWMLCAEAHGVPATAPDVWPSSVRTRLTAPGKVVALTFDACEAGERMQLDTRIIEFLVDREIPFTVFAGGRFVRDNRDAMADLARHPFVSIQNHTWSHPRDLRLLTDAEVLDQVGRAQAMIAAVTGRTPRYFRFPGGHADERTVALVESAGFEVVHWRWPEGDPDPRINADALVSQTLERTRSGDVLIFHVNGRGWHTAEALPRIIDGLRERGFRFVTLEEGFVPVPRYDRRRVSDQPSNP